MGYRAVLCYVEADARTAKRLHRALSRWRTPRPLIGLAGDYGPVPDTLQPIALLASPEGAPADLSPETRDVLNESEAMIVVCSPSAAGNDALDEQVVIFRRLGKEARIHAVIDPACEPAGEDAEFFPSALRGRGHHAFDLRPIRAEGGALVGEGLDGGAAKLAAALLGVTPETLARADRRGRDLTLRALALGLAGTGVAAALALAVAGVTLVQSGQAGRRAAMAERAQAQAAGERAALMQALGAERAAHAKLQTQSKADAAAALAAFDGMADASAAAIEAIGRAKQPTPEALRALQAIEARYGQLWAPGKGEDSLGLRVERILRLSAAAYLQLGETARGRAALERVRTLTAAWAEAAPDNPAWPLLGADAAVALAEVRRASGETTAQSRLLAEAARVYQRIGADPKVVTFARAGFPAGSSLRAQARVKFAETALALHALSETGRSLDLATAEAALAAIDAALSQDAAEPRVKDQGPALARRLRQVVEEKRS